MSAEGKRPWWKSPLAQLAGLCVLALVIVAEVAGGSGEAPGRR